jgi:hypothetical protein
MFADFRVHGLNDLFPMLSPPISTYLQEEKGGASPGLPVEFGGVGEPHAAFLTESRTRGHVRCGVGNPGRRSRLTHVRESPRTWGTRPGGKAWWQAGKAVDEMTANPKQS